MNQSINNINYSAVRTVLKLLSKTQRKDAAAAAAFVDVRTVQMHPAVIRNLHRLMGRFNRERECFISPKNVSKRFVAPCKVSCVSLRIQGGHRIIPT